MPGSGKSTLARLLSEDGKYPVFSVDDYFTNSITGEYKFDYTQNHFAYKQCQEKAERKMIEGLPKIFIDNTFVFEWEMEPYCKLAEKFDYTLFVITVENRHGSKNIHQISDADIVKMAHKFDVKLTMLKI